MTKTGFCPIPEVVFDKNHKITKNDRKSSEMTKKAEKPQNGQKCPDPEMRTRDSSARSLEIDRARITWNGPQGLSSLRYLSRLA